MKVRKLTLKNNSVLKGPEVSWVEYFRLPAFCLWEGFEFAIYRQGDWTLSHVSLHDIDTETSVFQSFPEAGCPWWSEGSGPKVLALHYPLAGLRLLQHVLPFLQLVVLVRVCKRWTGVWTAWIKCLEGRFCGTAFLMYKIFTASILFKNLFENSRLITYFT